MERKSEVSERRLELIAVAKGVLDGDFNWLDGVRRICDLRFAVMDPENPVFLPIVAIESDSDKFPIGAVRETYSEQALDSMDVELSAYFEHVREDVFQCCSEIVIVFQKHIDEDVTS